MRFGPVKDFLARFRGSRRFSGTAQEGLAAVAESIGPDLDRRAVHTATPLPTPTPASAARLLSASLSTSSEDESVLSRAEPGRPQHPQPTSR